MTYSCRFIFVHFNAWEYVGSDLLWAGIVTNLASAIEAKFGVVTSRIFRSLNVDVIHNDPRSNERTLLFDVPDGINAKQLKEVLKEYGTVKWCKKPIENGKLGENHQKWMVKYSHPMEAAKARKAMKSYKIKVTPYPNENQRVTNSSSNGSRPFCHFVKHFWKHPKTTLGLPCLCWWLLFYFAFLCLLFIASKVVEAFDLDVYQVSLHIERGRILREV